MRSMIVVLVLLLTACSTAPTVGPCRLDVECDPGLVCCTQPSMRNGMCSRDCQEPACTDGSECGDGTVCCPGHEDGTRACRPAVMGEMTACGACEDDEGCPGETVCCGTGAATFCATSCERGSFDAGLDAGPPPPPGDGGGADGRGVDGGGVDGGTCEPGGIVVVAVSGDDLGSDYGTVETFGTAPVVGPGRAIVYRAYFESTSGTSGEAWFREAGPDSFFDRPQGVTGVGASLPTESGSAMVLGLQGNPVIAADGTVGFQVVLAGASGRENAAYVHDPETASSTLLVRENQAGAGPLDEPFLLLEPFTVRDRRSAFDGTLVFHSRFHSAAPSPRVTDPYGIWRVTPGSAPSVVILEQGSPVGLPPDTATYAPAAPQVAVTAAGVLAIATDINRSPTLGQDIDRGIFRFGRGSDEQITTAMSFTGAYRHLGLNTRGDLAYVETGSGGTFVVAEAGPVAGAARGEPIPDLAESTFVAPSAGLAYLDDGRVVFAATISGSPTRTGVFEQIDSGIRTLALEGQDVPGEPGLTIADIETVHVNGDGGIAIRARLAGTGIRSGFDTAILMTAPNGDLRLVLRADTEVTYLCVARTIRQVSMLSDQLPGTDIEVFGPGHAGLPRAITDDFAAAVHVSFVTDDGSPLEAILLLAQPSSTVAP